MKLQEKGFMIIEFLLENLPLSRKLLPEFAVLQVPKAQNNQYFGVAYSDTFQSHFHFGSKVAYFLSSAT